jgi:hypothetical protein
MSDSQKFLVVPAGSVTLDRAACSLFSMAVTLLCCISVPLLSIAAVFLLISKLVVLSVQVRCTPMPFDIDCLRAANFRCHTWEW